MNKSNHLQELKKDSRSSRALQAIVLVKEKIENPTLEDFYVKAYELYKVGKHKSPCKIRNIVRRTLVWMDKKYE